MTSITALRNLSLAALASVSLGGCYYSDVYSASYAGADCSSRYGPSYWSNDPYAYDDGYYGYDCYDAADYRSGFVQIGFGGGWHQQFYYPGYGLFLFDRFGRRHTMSQDYLTYWGGRRAWWKHHGHRYGNEGFRRGHDGRRDGRNDGRRPGRGYGQGGDAFPGSSDGRWTNPPGAVPQDRARRDGRRGQSRGDGGGFVPEAGVTQPGVEAVPQQPPRMRRGGDGTGGGNGWGGRGAGRGGGNWAPPAGVAPPAAIAPEYVPPESAAPVFQPREPREPREQRVARPVTSYETPQPQRAAPQPGYSPPPVQERPVGRDVEAAIRED